LVRTAEIRNRRLNFSTTARYQVDLPPENAAFLPVTYPWTRARARYSPGPWHAVIMIEAPNANGIHLVCILVLQTVLELDRQIEIALQNSVYKP
jgi:hypothetical protein